MDPLIPLKQGIHIWNGVFKAQVYGLVPETKLLPVKLEVGSNPLKYGKIVLVHIKYRNLKLAGSPLKSAIRLTLG
jgi:hypothetical protein